MKTYKVIFERDNKSIGVDTFSANTPQEAKHDFKECYRHDIYKILSVEELPEKK